MLKGNIDFSSFKFVSRNPGDIIEAESFDEKYGSVACEATKDKEGGSENLGYIASGDWVKYSDVNFAYGAKNVAFRYASQNNALLELRLDSLDGPLLLDATLDGTSSWNTYNTANFELKLVNNKKVLGYHDIYLRFKSPVNLNWLTFEACDPVDPTLISLQTDSTTMTEGDSYWIDTYFEPYDASRRELTYTSENPAIATVSSYGEVIAVTPGTTVINIQSSVIPSLTAKLHVIVTKKPSENNIDNSLTGNITVTASPAPISSSAPINNAVVLANKLNVSVANYIGSNITLINNSKIKLNVTVEPSTAAQGYS